METKNTLRLKSIEIDKFRCFDHYKIEEIGKAATILIGKNGSGKTTLMKALKMGLSFIFAEVKEVKSITNGVKGVKIAQFNLLDGHYSWDEKEYQYPVSIDMSGYYQDKTLPSWTLCKTSESGGLLTTKYKSALLQFHQSYAKNRVLPLLAYYSDSYPHIGTRMSPYAKLILKSGRPIPREFGYYQWDADTSCSEIWETRWLNAFQNYNSKYAAISNFEKQIQQSRAMIELENRRKQPDVEKIKELELSIAEKETTIHSYQADANTWNTEKEYVLNLINKFIAMHSNSMPIKDIHLDYRSDKSVIIFRYEDNSQRTFHELPAGYKRLLSIVLDISYRAYLFTKGEYEPSGIVLIDEIDLHLHPSLEQNVMERFKNTFPNIQFIVTTHSPLVISNFKQDENNRIIVMKEEDGDYFNGKLTDIYGVDYSTVIRDAMNVQIAPTEIQVLVDDYLYLIEKSEVERAKAFLGKIIENYGETIAKKVEESAKIQLKLFQ